MERPQAWSCVVQRSPNPSATGNAMEMTDDEVQPRRLWGEAAFALLVAFALGLSLLWQDDLAVIAKRLLE
jgi:hypothetical protein